MTKHWFSDVRAFRHDPLALLDRVSKDTDRVFIPLALGPKPVLFVNDPNAAKPLMRLGEQVIDKGALVHKMAKVVGHSSLTLSGEAHDKRRAILNERLSRGMANSYLTEMDANITSVICRLAFSKIFHADVLGGQMALKLACVALFGHGVLSDADELAIMSAFVTIEADLQAEMFRFLPRSPWRKYREDRRRSEAMQIIASVVAKVEKAATNSSVLAGLKRAGLSDKEITDELTTLIIAGFHTTGSAVAWLCYYLAKEPHLADELRDEFLSIQQRGGVLDPARLPEAKKSIAFVKEVLRLYPSAWWFTREIKSDVSFGDYLLKAGTTLIFSPWVYHRTEKNFSQPTVFDISRSHSGSAYMPFGVGHRACVGMGVALVELQIIALNLSAAFRLYEPVELGHQLKPRAGITLNAPRMTMEIEVRSDGTDRKAQAA